MRKLRTFCGKVTEFLFLVFKQSVSNSRDFGFQKYIWSDITDSISPLSGEDQFVRFLRAFLKGLLFVFLYNYAVRLLYGKSEDGYGFYCLLK